jgi:N-acetylglucosaminyldiphosphoundecaprenol N-acetyl-beta-D-mannosaminyltransferase
MQTETNKRAPVISLMVDTISFAESLQKVLEWGLAHKPSFVCFANVHMVIEAKKDPLFQKQVEKADLVLPDGKPVVKAFQWLHGTRLERIAGMDFLPRILETANRHQARIFIYGSTNEVQEAMFRRIKFDFPAVHVAGHISPPFRKLSPEELQSYVSQINASGAHLVIVSLGCPKQEKWMAENSGSIRAVLLGLGGAMEVFAGKRRRAPEWMQHNSLEWLYRLYQEPRRMFRRYLYTNTFFIFLLAKKLLRR